MQEIITTLFQTPCKFRPVIWVDLELFDTFFLQIILILSYFKISV